MKAALPFVGVALLAAIGAFFAGRASAPTPESADAGDSSIPPRLQRDAERSLGSGASSRTLRPATDGPRRDRELPPEKAMQRVMAIADPLERAQAWLDFVNTLAPHEFEQVVRDFRASGFNDRETLTEYAMLLTAWGKADPLAALDYASDNTGSPFARNTILTSWAATDPEAAVRWAEQNHDGDGANPWMVGVIRGLAAHDQERATQLLTGMEFSRERANALDALLPHLLDQGVEVAQSWALAIDDPRLQSGAVSRIAEQMALEDPVAAADWLMASSEEAAQRSLDDVVATWAREDYDAALAFYEGLANPELKPQALRSLTRNLAARDAAAAASFLNDNAQFANDRVYRDFVWHAFGDEPEMAANHIGMIEDQGDRDRTYRRMLEGWLRRDFDAASSWIGANELPENVAKRLERRILEMREPEG